MKRTVVTVLGIALALALLPAGSALADTGRSGEQGSGNMSTIAVYGDSPYGTSNADTAQFDATPAFINSINADPNVSLVMHVGDIHSGKQFCTQPYDQSIFDRWTQFQDPLVYTPGDNEWTDCHKAGEGGNVFVGGNPVDYANGDPVANLALIRSMFFARPGLTLGNNKKLVLSQGFAYDRRYRSDSQYVENVMWLQSGVLFVTINLPGGSNNGQDVWYGAATETAAQTQERTERTGADRRWLDTAFAVAKFTRVKGVVIDAQADMWDPEKAVAGGTTHQEGYEPFVQSIAAHTTEFAKPVLMFNGDSHVYRSDNPLSAAAPCTWEKATPCTSVAFLHPGYDVPNFHRVVVHGSTVPLEWLKLTVDPSANLPATSNTFGPFSWERKTQP
jgi:hypothetical protein